MVRHLLQRSGQKSETRRHSTPLRLLRAHTAGSRIRGSRWQMRDEMRRRPDRLRLALRLSGEHLQIAALLGGSEAAGQGAAIESSVPCHTSRSTPQDLVFPLLHQKVINSALLVGAKRVSFVAYMGSNDATPLLSPPGSDDPNE